jgi:hypothetical protein
VLAFSIDVVGGPSLLGESVRAAFDGTDPQLTASGFAVDSLAGA